MKKSYKLAYDQIDNHFKEVSEMRQELVDFPISEDIMSYEFRFKLDLDDDF